MVFYRNFSCLRRQYKTPIQILSLHDRPAYHSIKQFHKIYYSIVQQPRKVIIIIKSHPCQEERERKTTKTKQNKTTKATRKKEKINPISEE